MSTTPARFTVALLAFNGMEALDFAGPFEVFTTASRVHARARQVENENSIANESIPASD